MGTEKRARQKANRAAKQAEAAAEAKSENREASTRRIGLIVGVVVAVIAAIALFQWLSGGDDEAATISFAPTPGPDEVVEAPAAELASEVPDDFEPFAGTGALAAVEPAARANAYDEAPTMVIDPANSYAAVINTDVGALRFELHASESPLTVNNFVSLARDGYYDGLNFHRVIDGFMAQGGDPTGTGAGGPGYQFADELDNGLVFDKVGQLAMANSGPATNGSQFFITFVPTDHLTGAHTIFGQYVGDEALLDQIVRSDSGDPATIINSIRIAEI